MRILVPKGTPPSAVAAAATAAASARNHQHHQHHSHGHSHPNQPHQHQSHAHHRASSSSAATTSSTQLRYGTSGSSTTSSTSSSSSSTIPASTVVTTTMTTASSNARHGRPRVPQNMMAAPTSNTANHSSSTAYHNAPALQHPTTTTAHHIASSSTSSTSSAAEGYNSDDELSQPRPRQSLIDDEQFALELKRKHGFEILPMAEDGNCLFRSVAHQIYGDPEMHDQIRQLCMDYMELNRDHFSQYVTEEWSDYIRRKRQDRCFGNHAEMQAMSELFNRPIEVYAHCTEPLNIFHGQYNAADNPPIRLSYHHGNHYNSVIHPDTPAVGVGLGLPSLEPGLADKLQMQQATAASETEALEQQLLEGFKREAEMLDVERELEKAAVEASIRDAPATMITHTLPFDDEQAMAWLGADTELQAALAASCEELLQQRRQQHQRGGQ